MRQRTACIYTSIKPFANYSTLANRGFGANLAVHSLHQDAHSMTASMSRCNAEKFTNFANRTTEEDKIEEENVNLKN
jgi:hypothetical protein